MNESPAPRPATVADVARAANVSKAQAARALGGYGAVSEPVRRRVLDAAEELNYRPNALARSMNTGRSQTIGVVIAEVENPFFGLAIRGASDVLRRHGYDVVLANTDERTDAEEDAIRVMLDKRVDGIIASPADADATAHLSAAMAAGSPMVFLDRHVPGMEVDSVEVDLRRLAGQATAELLELGHRGIGFISAVQAPSDVYEPGMTLPNSSVADRLGGILDAYARAGIEPDPRWMRLNAKAPETIRAATQALLDLDDAPTAIIASDSMVGLEVLKVLRERSLRVPEDVSFLMFDDMAWSPLVDPPITVLSQPAYDMGVAAATALLERLRGSSTPPCRRVLEGEMIRRASVAPARAAVDEAPSMVGGTAVR
ncbi:LacI family DNA-binding transcriptional regulator [Zhihengliuella sp.]|uniref:LacI family DNA-binding transcriptional regulator n=1 Tax=Zhihengliuella sp. TaxID=1954483 RepID=UPI0028111170|nr:LacI family DNA-binding transcriptional regulator [Zhihengliuella sp.]